MVYCLHNTKIGRDFFFKIQKIVRYTRINLTFYFKVIEIIPKLKLTKYDDK